MIAARILKEWPIVFRRQAGLARLFTKGEGKKIQDKDDIEGQVELEKDFKDEILTRDTLNKYA